MEDNDLGIKKSITEIFEVIQLINTSNGGTIFNFNEIEQQNYNINNLQGVIKRLKNTLEDIKRFPNADNQMLLKQIVELHLILNDIEWQYLQIHDMVRKVMGR